MAGVNTVRVSYKGGGEAIMALIGGQLQLVFGVPAAVMPQVTAGKLKALAVSSAEPSPLAPGLPTMAASGLPGYESTSLAGMFAPAGTPPAIVNQLSEETRRIINRPETRNQLISAGVEGISCSPRQFAAVLKADMAKWGKVIRDAGIHE
jgi:tripartite-type tricarboxylate transporter receptor subunit TctC